MFNLASRLGLRACALHCQLAPDFSIFAGMLAVYLLLVFSTATVGFKIFVMPQKRSSSTTLNARKHLASVYGDALDALRRRNKYENQLEATVERLGIKELLEEQQDKAKSGTDKRRGRNRSLKETFATQTPWMNYGTREQKERNWSQNQIEIVMKLMNDAYMYERKQVSRQQVSEDKQRAFEEGELFADNFFSVADLDDLIKKQNAENFNWELFDMMAAERIPGYEEEEQISHNIKQWLSFHIKKTDIRFEDNAWVWDPEGAYRRGRDKMRARARSGDKLRPPGSKAKRRRKFTRRPRERAT